MAASEEKLCQLVERFGGVCRKNLTVNEDKDKVMKCTRGVDSRRMNVVFNGELLEVKCFKYIGSKMKSD